MTFADSSLIINGNVLGVMGTEKNDLDEYCPDCGHEKEPYITVPRDEPSPDERVKFTCSACNTAWQPKWENVSEDYEWPWN